MRLYKNIVFYEEKRKPKPERVHFMSTGGKLLKKTPIVMVKLFFSQEDSTE